MPLRNQQKIDGLVESVAKRIDGIRAQLKESVNEETLFYADTKDRLAQIASEIQEMRELASASDRDSNYWYEERNRFQNENNELTAGVIEIIKKMGQS